MLDEIYIYPLIVPKSYYVKGVWEMPHHTFPIEKELADIKKMLKKTLQGASVPMSDEFYRPDQFMLPESWLRPMDQDHANRVIEKIVRLSNHQLGI